jgi:hypothetical protein
MRKIPEPEFDDNKLFASKITQWITSITKVNRINGRVVSFEKQLRS